MDYSPPGSFVHGISPGKNIGVGCPSFLQGIFPTESLLGSNPGLLYRRHILYRATREAACPDAQSFPTNELLAWVLHLSGWHHHPSSCPRQLLLSPHSLQPKSGVRSSPLGPDQYVYLSDFLSKPLTTESFVLLHGSVLQSVSHHSNTENDNFCIGHWDNYSKLLEKAVRSCLLTRG